MVQGGDGGAEGRRGRSRKRRWPLVLVVVAVLGIAGFFVYRSGAVDLIGKSGDAVLGVTPDMNEDQAQQQRNTALSEGMQHVSINPHFLFKSGSSEGNLDIENDAQSRYAYVVSITRDDTGEEVYKSGLLKPGYRIDEAHLSMPLPEGDISATARFVAYNVSGGDPIGAAVKKIIITVKS